jgi:hypothetical protein
MAKLYEIPDGLGHPIINPFGIVILVSQYTLRILDMFGYLHRDKESGLKRIDKVRYLVFLECERGTDYFAELGEDFSGANVVICNCQKCKEKISQDTLISDIRTRQAA